MVIYQCHTLNQYTSQLCLSSTSQCLANTIKIPLLGRHQIPQMVCLVDVCLLAFYALQLGFIDYTCCVHVGEHWGYPDVVNEHGAIAG